MRRISYAPFAPFSVSAFFAARPYYYTSEQKASLFSDLIPRRGAGGQDLLTNVLRLLKHGGKVLLVGEGGIGKSTLAYPDAWVAGRRGTL